MDKRKKYYLQTFVGRPILKRQRAGSLFEDQNRGHGQSCSGKEEQCKADSKVGCEMTLPEPPATGQQEAQSAECEAQIREISSRQSQFLSFQAEQYKPHDFKTVFIKEETKIPKKPETEFESFLCQQQRQNVTASSIIGVFETQEKSK